MNWFKKKPDPSLLIEIASLPENLEWAKSYLKNTPINNGDLRIDPAAVQLTAKSPLVPGYLIYYKKALLGQILLNDENPKVKKYLVKEAQKFCPELFPVRVGEYFQFDYGQIFKVVDLFIHQESGKLTYILECVCKNEKSPTTHSTMVDYAIKISRVG